MKDRINEYLRVHRARFKPSTYLDYRSALRCHFSHFKTFEDLNRNLEEYLADLVVTGKRRNNLLSVARSFLAWGLRRELWEGRIMKVPRFPYRSKRVKPLSPKGAQAVMNWMPPPYKDWFRLSILTGLRTGEALALRFEDLDPHSRVLVISRTLSGGKIVSPNTSAGEREIPILRPVWEIFQRRQIFNSRGSPWVWYGATRGIFEHRYSAGRLEGLLKGF